MKNSKGFTLIELLVVIAIIALLLAIVLPALRAAKNRGKDVICLNNLKQIGTAVFVYAQAYNDFVPRGAGNANDEHWQELFMPYIGGVEVNNTKFWDVEIYNCPAYPVQEQIVDYTLNAFKSRNDPYTPTSGGAASEVVGFSKLSQAKSPGSYVYMADYDDTTINKLDFKDGITDKKVFIIKATDALVTQRDVMRWIDVWTSTHLSYYPYNPTYNTNLNCWRVSRTRHRQTGNNNLYLDGHSGWLYYKENTPEKWNVQGW